MISWFKKIWVGGGKTLTVAVATGWSYGRLDANSGDSQANGASTPGALINTERGAGTTLHPQTTVFKLTVVWGSDAEVSEGNILWQGSGWSEESRQAGTLGFWPKGIRKGGAGRCPWCWGEQGAYTLPGFPVSRPTQGVK